MLLSLFLAAMIFPPSPDDAAIADAQQRFRTAIAAPAQPEAKLVAGADADPCVTSYSTIYWDRPPAILSRIDWHRADYARYQQGNPDSVVASLENRIEIAHGADIAFLQPAPAQVQPILAAAADLIRLCHGVAPLGPPLPVGEIDRPVGPFPSGAIGERRKLSPIVPGSGGHRCVFSAVPELEFDYPGARAISASWTARPRVLVFDTNALSISINPQGPAVSGWRDLGVMVSFTVASAAHHYHPIASARILVDGRAVPIALRARSPDWSDYYVGVMPLDDADNGPLVAALAAGKIAELRLYDAEGVWIGRWDYDVRTLRDVPASLAIAQWRC